MFPRTRKVKIPDRVLLQIGGRAGTTPRTAPGFPLLPSFPYAGEMVERFPRTPILEVCNALEKVRGDIVAEVVQATGRIARDMWDAFPEEEFVDPTISGTLGVFVAGEPECVCVYGLGEVENWKPEDFSSWFSFVRRVWKETKHTREDCYIINRMKEELGEGHNVL